MNNQKKKKKTEQLTHNYQDLNKKHKALKISSDPKKGHLGDRTIKSESWIKEEPLGPGPSW